MFDPPILINVRDRVTPLRDLVDWLERAGHEHIILLDNASTYPPLLQYLEETPHELVRLGENLGARGIWDAQIVPDGWFVYTDPDLVPTADCPTDAVARLRELLERYPEFPKAGLGLYLDDVPATMPSLDWERSLVTADREIEPGAFDSLVDTTFALHRPDAEYDPRAIRTGAPYLVRHASWYVTELDDENRYYLEHATDGPRGSSWKGWA